jgi:hypothetical protein
VQALDAFARETVGGECEAELGGPLGSPLVVEEDAVGCEVDGDARVCDGVARLPLCEELERVEWEAKGLVQGHDGGVYGACGDVLGEVDDIVYDAAELHAADGCGRRGRPWPSRAWFGFGLGLFGL